MKIYISTDLEGVTGVWKYTQINRDSPDYLEAARMLMHDISAVSKGLQQAGVKEIYVVDGHEGGNNFIPELMVPGVRYITGRRRPRLNYMLDETFSGHILLGCHAMNGTLDGILHHTQAISTEPKYFYDGVERGEIYQEAVVSGYFNVPVILVTGDEAACREARITLGENTPTIAVKKGIHREAGVLLSPEETGRMLTEGARQAVAKIPELSPYKVKLPIKLVVKRKGPEGATPENPYYVEEERIVKKILPFDIITGSKD